MKNIISSFISALLGSLIYSGLIQYSDAGNISIFKLIFDPKPWIIALFIAAVVTIWTNFFDKKETDDNLNTK